MAARNPSSWTEFLSFDSDVVASGRVIYAALSDNIYDDQEYCLDAEQMVVTDFFRPFEVAYSESTNDYVHVRNYYIMAKDMCDVSGITNDETGAVWCALVWASDASTEPIVRVTSSDATTNASSTNTRSAPCAAPDWTDFSHGAQNIGTNNDEDKITVELAVNAGSGTGSVYIAGFGLFASET